MDYSLVDLINKIGLQNIHVQQLSNTFCNLKRRKDDIGEFTFITEQDHLPDLNLTNQQLDFKYEGIVVWAPMDKMHEAVSYFQNTPDHLIDVNKPTHAYHLRFESGWCKVKSMVTYKLTPEVVKKFLLSTEPFIENFESSSFSDDGLCMMDYIDKVINYIDYSENAVDEQEIHIVDGDNLSHSWYITKSEII